MPQVVGTSRPSVLADVRRPMGLLSPVSAEVGFGVLGPVTVSRHGDVTLLPTGKPTTLLACLLLRPNVVVSAERLKTAVWDQHGVANTALHTGMRRLRRMLATHGVSPAVVQAEAGGYRVAVAAEALDLTRFRARVAAARAADDPFLELQGLREALGEWRGPVLSNVTSAVLHRDEVPRLFEERLSAHERAVDLELRLGRCREVLAELWELTRANPDRERFWEQLIEALYRTGRQAEALAEYRGVKGHLRRHLGIDPGPALQRLELTILRGDDLAPVAPDPVRMAARDRRPLLPTSPLATATFVGRRDSCTRLTTLLAGAATAPTTLVLSGAPGIGKTALALHLAESLRDRFPGGQVAVRTTHPDGTPRPPDTVASEIAGATDPQGPRLVVLDDVVDPDLVALAAPLGPRDVTLVTSRLSLARLMATRPRTLTHRVGPFTGHDAHDFLVETLGAERVDREPEAAARLADLCDHYPLALRIATTRLMTRPLLALGDYVTWLAADPLGRLSLGVDDRLSVNSALDAAVRRLDPDLADAFERVGRSHPDTAAGSEDLLHRLADAGFLEEEQPGRFRMHDLLRRFATTGTRAETSEPRKERVS